MKRFTLRVDGMKCDGCAASVAAALERTEGVRQVEVSLARGEAGVQADPATAPEALIAAVEDAGYEATLAT